MPVAELEKIAQLCAYSLHNILDRSKAIDRPTVTDKSERKRFETALSALLSLKYDEDKLTNLTTLLRFAPFVQQEVPDRVEDQEYLGTKIGQILVALAADLQVLEQAKGITGCTDWNYAHKALDILYGAPSSEYGATLASRLAEIGLPGAVGTDDVKDALQAVALSLSCLLSCTTALLLNGADEGPQTQSGVRTSPQTSVDDLEAKLDALLSGGGKRESEAIPLEDEDEDDFEDDDSYIPTFPRISKAYMDGEILNRNRETGTFFLIQQEMSNEETDEMFEQTRRLRESRPQLPAQGPVESMPWERPEEPTRSKGTSSRSRDKEHASRDKEHASYEKEYVSHQKERAKPDKERASFDKEHASYDRRFA